jgi:hypothetical protein
MFILCVKFPHAIAPVPESLTAFGNFKRKNGNIF